jgi:hypothetical protein
MISDPRVESPQVGWACGACTGRNQPEDRYCGDCGAPRNATIVRPVFHAPATSAGLLPELVEPKPPLLHGGLCLFFAGLAAAALFGALFHYAARVRDIKLVLPILVGLGVGWAIRVAAIRSRCRTGVLIVGAAFLAGAAAYGVRQALDTAQFQKEKIRILEEQAREESLIDGRSTVVHYEFFDALHHRAEMGLGFNVGRRSDAGALKGGWFWRFLLIETLLVAVAAAASVRSLSRHAYCGGCRAFVPSVAVYRVNARDGAALADAVRRQKWKEAQEMTNRASATPADRAEAALLRCSKCNSSSIRVDVRRGRRSKKVMHVVLPAESLETLARSA